MDNDVQMMRVDLSQDVLHDILNQCKKQHSSICLFSYVFLSYHVSHLELM